MKIKLMIFGYARHGKDTVAEILRDAYGLTFQSSSFAAAERVMIPYFRSIGIEYSSLDECYADRVNHRHEWYEQIRIFNALDGARLGREIYANNDIYVGVRSVEEFNAIRDAGLFQYSIWVDRSKYEPPEPPTSNKTSSSMADYVLDNNGTLEQLKIKTRSLYVDLMSLEYAAKGFK